MSKLSTMALVDAADDDVRLYAYDPSETLAINRSKAITVGQIRNVLTYPVEVGELGVVDTNWPVGNVKRYGATGNSVTDDTTAFNTAVTAVVTLNTLRVIVPEGMFALTNSVVLQSGVKISGVGHAQSRCVFSYVGGIGFYGQGVVNCLVEHIGIQGLLAMGVVFNLSSKVKVRSCEITGCTSNAHPTTYVGGVHCWVCDDVDIYDNYMFGNGYISNNPASSDIQINGNGLNVGNKRVRIFNNRCLSTNSQTCIAAYDVQQSEITGNVCTGAKTGTGNNNGYGIMIYKTVNNSGFCRDNRVENNHVFSVQGTGIYIQSSIRTAVIGNVVYDAGTVQDDTSLPVGGVSLNSSYDSIVKGNVLIDCGKSGVVFSGLTTQDISGIIVEGNTIDSSVVLAYGIFIRGPANRCIVAGNAIKGGNHGITSLPVDQGIIGITIIGNNIAAPVATATRAINIYGISESTIKDNTIIGSGGDGLALVGGSRNTVSQNTIFDGGVFTNNTYMAIELSLILDSIIEGNVCGNTVATGYKHGIYIPANCTGNVVRGNHCKGAVTANFNVDTSAASGNSFHGNYDAGTTFAQWFGARQQAVIQGGAASVTQLLLGDSSSSGAVGTGFSGGDTFLAQNSRHVLGGVDLWHQNNAAAASKLLIMRANGDLEWYSAPAGTADATFAVFWGTAKMAFTATGQLKTSNATFLQSTVALTNGAAAAAGTIANAPVAGNPTKWIPINDNGTTRFIPAW